METVVVTHSQRSEHLTVGFQPREKGDKGVLDMSVATFLQLEIASM